MKINTMEYKIMNERGETALYWRWRFSVNGCDAKECIRHQVWF